MVKKPRENSEGEALRAVVSYVGYQRENNEGGGQLRGLLEGEQ